MKHYFNKVNCTSLVVGIMLMVCASIASATATNLGMLRTQGKCMFENANHQVVMLACDALYEGDNTGWSYDADSGVLRSNRTNNCISAKTGGSFVVTASCNSTDPLQKWTRQDKKFKNNSLNQVLDFFQYDNKVGVWYDKGSTTDNQNWQSLLPPYAVKLATVVPEDSINHPIVYGDVCLRYNPFGSRPYMVFCSSLERSLGNPTTFIYNNKKFVNPLNGLCLASGDTRGRDNGGPNVLSMLDCNNTQYPSAFNAPGDGRLVQVESGENVDLKIYQLVQFGSYAQYLFALKITDAQPTYKFTAEVVEGYVPDLPPGNLDTLISVNKCMQLSGSAVTMENCTSELNQKWTFTEKYQISSQSDSSKCLATTVVNFVNVVGRVEVVTCANDLNQQWKINSNKITHLRSGLVLDYYLWQGYPGLWYDKRNSDTNQIWQ